MSFVCCPASDAGVDIILWHCVGHLRNMECDTECDTECVDQVKMDKRVPSCWDQRCRAQVQGPRHWVHGWRFLSFSERWSLMKPTETVLHIIKSAVLRWTGPTSSTRLGRGVKMFALPLICATSGRSILLRQRARRTSAGLSEAQWLTWWEVAMANLRMRRLGENIGFNMFEYYLEHPRTRYELEDLVRNGATVTRRASLRCFLSQSIPRLVMEATLFSGSAMILQPFIGSTRPAFCISSRFLLRLRIGRFKNNIMVIWCILCFIVYKCRNRTNYGARMEKR